MVMADVFGGMNIVTGGWESVKTLDKMRDMLTLAVMKLAHWYQSIWNLEFGGVEGATNY
jgi:hypothetical protein